MPAAEFDTDRNPPRSELLVVEQAADPVSQPDEDAQFTAAAPPDDSEIRDGAGTTAQPVCRRPSLSEMSVMVTHLFAALGGRLPDGATVTASHVGGEPAETPSSTASEEQVADQQSSPFQDRVVRNRALVFLFGRTAVSEPPVAPAAQVATAADENQMSRSATAETADDEGASAIAATDSEPPRSNENPSLAATSADIDAQLPTLADDISAPQETATRESGENERAELPVAVLVIVNPVDSGGEIFYLVDGESFALRPGNRIACPPSVSGESPFTAAIRSAIAKRRCWRAGSSFASLCRAGHS